MKIYHNHTLIAELSNKFLFFDNNSLVHIIAYEKLFSPLVTNLREKGCEFVTIPSVKFEFSRTNTIEGFNKRTKFLQTFAATYPIEKHMGEFSDLILVLQKINGTMSYTDFLLYCCLYKFPTSFLLTENHNDFITTILDRIDLITIDNDTKSVKSLGLYKFSKEKYEKAAEKILKEK